MKRPKFIAAQADSPAGLLGRFLLWIMSFETKSANRKTLQLLQIEENDSILEIGFGHGRTIQAVAAIAKSGFVAGVESSTLALETARKRNYQNINQGQIELSLSTDGALPYPSSRFQKVFSVHSVYFWPDIEGMLKEILRVLTPGGRLILCFRYDATFRQSFPSDIYSFRSPKQIGELLSKVGFLNIRTISEKSHTGELYWTVGVKTEIFKGAGRQ